MPKWGLTVQQRRAKPWGLSAEWLAPDKTITDPIHGDIYLTRLERRFLDSAPLQRLRRIRQLGATHLVYPGASHTRLSHSLGALRVAQNLLDAVIDQRNGPHPVRDLFEEWAGLPVVELDRKFAEATVLARLGGLLHDLCHVAFGHSIEDDLGILEAHDDNFSRFDTLWSKFDDELRRAVDGPLREALAPLIISKAKAEGKKVDPDAPPPGPYPFVHDIVGNTICADLIDYLARDHYYTGLPAKLGHRFIDGFYVTPADHRLYPQRMAILIQVVTPPGATSSSSRNSTSTFATVMN